MWLLTLLAAMGLAGILTYFGSRQIDKWAASLDERDGDE